MATNQDRGAKFTVSQGSRTHTITILRSVAPEEILVWMSKAEVFYTITGEENTMTALGRDVKDQMLKPNMG